MADIRYTPITGGQAFGSAGEFFKGAAASLSNATRQASSAFGTLQQGAVDAKNKRTQDAITAIQGARTVEEYDALAAGLGSPEQFSQSFGDIDVNKAVGALRAQQGVAQKYDTDLYNFNQGIAKRADSALLKNVTSQLGTLKSSELDALPEEFFSNFNSQLNDSSLLTDAVNTAKENRLTKDTAVYNLNRSREADNRADIASDREERATVANLPVLAFEQGERLDEAYDTPIIQDVLNSIGNTPTAELKGVTSTNFDLTGIRNPVAARQAIESAIDTKLARDLKQRSVAYKAASDNTINSMFPTGNALNQEEQDAFLSRVTNAGVPRGVAISTLKTYQDGSGGTARTALNRTIATENRKADRDASKRTSDLLQKFDSTTYFGDAANSPQTRASNFSASLESLVDSRGNRLVSNQEINNYLRSVRTGEDEFNNAKAKQILAEFDTQVRTDTARSNLIKQLEAARKGQ